MLSICGIQWSRHLVDRVGAPRLHSVGAFAPTVVRSVLPFGDESVSKRVWMQRPPMKSFTRFRLDPVNQCLWRRADTEHEERVLLTPKAFSVLTYLVNHAGRLVTHDELLNSVWSRTVVEPQTVKKHIVEVRTALGDRPKNSLFIETLPRRGYRFVAPVSESVASERIVSGRTARSALVGRGGALEELYEAWQHAVHGERQIVFITGEPGIGKSALAEVFFKQAAPTEKSVRIA